MLKKGERKNKQNTFVENNVTINTSIITILPNRGHEFNRWKGGSVPAMGGVRKRSERRSTQKEVRLAL